MALPAVASDGETVVVAETGNLNADHGRGLQYSGACVRGNVISIVITGLNQNLTSSFREVLLTFVGQGYLGQRGLSFRLRNTRSLVAALRLDVWPRW